MTADSFSKRIANKRDFLPQSVPVTRVDADLPKIPPTQQTPAAIEAHFLHHGGTSSSSLRLQDCETTSQGENGQQRVKAAVLVPIWRSSRPSVLLTQRSQTLSSHAGQIALPGGRMDRQDASFAGAALREAEEEVGLPARFVTVLGALPHFYTNTGYEICPIVGLVEPEAKAFIQANPGEVDEVFDVPLDFLLDPANHRHHHYRDNALDRQWISIPYSDAAAGKERFIWGVTASILRSFYRFMQVP